MIKAERDEIMRSIGREERIEFENILQEVLEKAETSSAPRTTLMKLWKSRANRYSPQLQRVLEAVFLRDELGPNEGEVPPDFNLKRLGSQDRPPGAPVWCGVVSAPPGTPPSP